MKKFYCFTAGEELPSWMWRVSCESRESCFKNKGGKVTFGVSCIAVRESGKRTKLIPTKLGADFNCVNVVGFYDSIMGGVDGASGVFICEDEFLHLHGKGLRYKVGNSKIEPILEAK